MQNYLQASYLGLPDPEVKILDNMFALVPQLQENYRFSGADAIRHADIVLINGDYPAAVKMWDKVSSVNSLATPLVLSAKGKRVPGAISLKRPLRLHKLIAALERIAIDQSIIIPPEKQLDTDVELQVLVVDDSYPVRKYMENKFSELINKPIHISFASSGEEALIKFSQRTYDLVFLDVVMPGIDGYHVCKALKAFKDIYIVMLTSKKSPFDKIRGTLSGCNSFITKPPSDQSLINEIEACIKCRLEKGRGAEQQATSQVL